MKNLEMTNQANQAPETVTTVTPIEDLRRTQTRPLSSDDLKKFVAEYSTEVTLETNTKYGYGFSIIVNDKKFGEIWAKKEAVRLTISKRNIKALDGFTVDGETIDLKTRTAIKKDRDTGEEYTVETEFVLRPEELKAAIKCIKTFAEAKSGDTKPESKPQPLPDVPEVTEVFVDPPLKPAAPKRGGRKPKAKK